MKQDVVVNLFGVPSEVVMEGLLRVGARRLIKLFVFRRAEPRAMYDIALRLIGRGKVGQVSEPFVTDRGFEHLAQSHDLVVDRAARRRLVRDRTVRF